MRSHDWSRTPLGAPENWPQSLRTAVRILLTSRYQMWMGWGEDLTFFYNDAYRPTLGVKHEGALGSPASLVWKEIWPDIGPRIDKVLKTGEATWDEGLLLFLERSGYSEETYHTFSYSPLSNDSGKVVGMLCVVTEETERLIGERRVASLRQLASEMTGKNTSPSVLAAAENVLGANPRDLPFTLLYLMDESGSGAHLAGSTGIGAGHVIAPAIIGPDDSSLWPLSDIAANRAQTTIYDLSRFAGLPGGAWDKPAIQAAVVPIARQGQDALSGFLVAGINPYRRMDDGYEGYLSLTAGQIASALSNARAYEEERSRAEALAEIDRAKTAFFSNTSHEFRTPLTLILGPLTDMLARRPLQGPILADAAEIEAMHRNGVRLLKLVNTLLDFSRIEAGRVQAQFEATDLATYTAELASTFRSAMQKAGLEFVVECPPLSENIYIDRSMWEKIVLNLISNAFKFTLSGRVVVSLAQRDGGVRLTVRDTGVGIAEQELPRLFERFHRIEGQRGRTQEGTGIGLALVFELVRLHGGAVDAQSVLGEGSAISVTIPQGAAHLPGDPVRTDTLAQPAAVNAYVSEALRWLPAENVLSTDIADPDVWRGPDGGASARSTVLVADDNSDMRDYLSRLLSAQYDVQVVGDGQAALEAIRRRRPDLVLSDVMMPHLDGFELLREIRADEQLRDIPLILLSARAGEEASVEGLNAGADDYLVKPFSARELLARVGANIDLSRLRRESLKLEQELRAEAQQARERSDAILASINDGFFALDRNWRFTYVNPAAERILNQPAEELIGRSHWEMYPSVKDSPLEAKYRAVMESRVGNAFENYYEPWGRWFDIRLYPSRDGGVSVCFQDITDKKATEASLQQLNENLEQRVQVELTHRRQAEEALLQAQKMEAVGQLTGGIAHDFNNLLAGILGSLELAKSKLPHEHAAMVMRYLDAAAGAANRAAALTQRLLAFSRRQTLDPKPVYLDELVAGMTELIHRSIGPNIEMRVASGKVSPILADSGQMENALLNLCINARDAMPDGGTLTIETAEECLDALSAAPRGLAPGDYIRLSVTDTGTGMPPEVLARAFDPFFTTKPLGQGTGLGLSMVYGFAQQSGGHVAIQSQTGEGTTVQIHMPRYLGVSPAEQDQPADAQVSGRGRGQKILVVDDEPLIRMLVMDALEEARYSGIEANEGPAALKILQSEPGVQMLITDVGLPGGLNGRQLADAARVARPGLKVLFITGYAEKSVIGDGGLDAGMQILAKPFQMETLTRKIREMVEG